MNSPRFSAGLALALSILLLMPFVAYGQSSAGSVVSNSGTSIVQRNGERELLALHRSDRRAHFDHDIPTLLAGVGTELLDVRDGKVNRMSREDIRRQFAHYFQHAQFISWDDLEPPIVRVSRDGNMAWMIVRVKIRYTEKDAVGKSTTQGSNAAWMSAYEKRDGKWIMVAVTSTSDELASSR
jgi:hypothetical protein